MPGAEYDVGFSVSPSVENGVLDPTVAILTDAGLAVRTEHRDSDIYASASHWMTGVVVILGTPVWTGFKKALDEDLEELGKSLYRSKRGRLAVWTEMDGYGC